MLMLEESVCLPYNNSKLAPSTKIKIILVQCSKRLQGTGMMLQLCTYFIMESNALREEKSPVQYGQNRSRKPSNYWQETWRFLRKDIVTRTLRNIIHSGSRLGRNLPSSHPYRSPTEWPLPSIEGENHSRHVLDCVLFPPWT